MCVDIEVGRETALIAPIRRLHDRRRVQLVRQRPGSPQQQLLRPDLLVGRHPVAVLILHRGKDLVQVEVEDVTDEGAEVAVAGGGADPFDELGAGEEDVGLVLHEAQHDLDE